MLARLPPFAVHPDDAPAPIDIRPGEPDALGKAAPGEQGEAHQGVIVGTKGREERRFLVRSQLAHTLAGLAATCAYGTRSAGRTSPQSLARFSTPRRGARQGTVDRGVAHALPPALGDEASYHAAVDIC